MFAPRTVANEATDANHFQALLNLPEKVGVTASLNINYKAPTRADQFIVIKVKLDEAQGRKARVSGTVEDMSGKVLVEAKCVALSRPHALC